MISLQHIELEAKLNVVMDGIFNKLKEKGNVINSIDDLKFAMVLESDTVCDNENFANKFLIYFQGRKMIENRTTTRASNGSIAFIVHTNEFKEISKQLIKSLNKKCKGNCMRVIVDIHMNGEPTNPDGYIVWISKDSSSYVINKMEAL